MLLYEPVHPKYHAEILGKDFANRFADEMQAFYAPFANKGRPIQLAKETWEYAVADAIPDGQWYGAGNSIVDVKTPTADLDVKGISSTNLTGTTSEASILQNHEMKHDNFMNLFETGDFSGLQEIYVSKLIQKIAQATNLHILCCVRNKKANDVFYALLKVSQGHLNEKQFVKQMQPMNARSVSTPIMDPTFGKVYLYIPKRRLELRLHLAGMKDYLVYSHSYQTPMK